MWNGKNFWSEKSLAQIQSLREKQCTNNSTIVIII